MSSVVRECNWVRDCREVVFGRGRVLETSRSRGRRSSMNSSSGGRVRGEKSGYDSDWSKRVWWRTCVESAECAVLNLSHVSMGLRQSLEHRCTSSHLPRHWPAIQDLSSHLSLSSPPHHLHSQNCQSPSSPDSQPDPSSQQD